MGCLHVRVVMLLFICKCCLTAIYQPPKIVYPSVADDLYYRESAKVEIKCVSLGLPKPKYRWTQNGSDIESRADVKYDQSTGVLQFSSFTAAHENSYRCIATNVYGSEGEKQVNVSCMSASLRLRRIRLESFGSRLVNLTRKATEFEYVMLPCGDSKSSVAEKVTYAWYETKTGKMLDMTDRRLYIDRNGSLHFAYVLLRDREVAGYTCGVSLTIGIHKYTENGTNNILFVKPRENKGVTVIAPVFQYSNSPVKARTSSSPVLECVFSGVDSSHYTLPSQTWKTRSGALVTNDTKYSISADGRQLTIAKVMETDDNLYTCHAKNSAGDAISVVLIRVTSVPYFSSGPLLDQTVNEGTDVDFKCDARSPPKETPPGPPVWYVNAKKLGSNQDTAKFHFSNSYKIMTIAEVKKPDDVICVQCEVSNNVGTVLSNACLSVIGSRQESIATIWIVLIGMANGFLLLANCYILYKILTAKEKEPDQKQSKTESQGKEAPKEAESASTLNEGTDVEDSSPVASAIDSGSEGTEIA